MSQDLQKAKALLTEGYTCALCRDDRVFTSQQRGVAPLLALLEDGSDLRGFSAADKVVGRGAAFLYCLLGVRAVHAQVLSRPAREVLSAKGILVSCDTLVEGIRNRDNTGPCPMEQATLDCCDPEEALAAIRQTLKKLRSGD